MEADLRTQGLAHAISCANCASRLSEAKHVRAVLQTAASAETQEAPARVKQSLLAAFAERGKGAVTPAPVVEISSRRRWLSVAAIAAAAVLLIALVLPTLWKLAKPAPRNESAKVDGGNPIPAAATPERSPEQSVLPVDKKSLTARKTPVSAPHATIRTPRVLNRALATTAPETVSTKKNTNEYVPLTYLASATAMESGTVVRVQLSRSALMSLGLPLNIERADGLIKADLMVGDDGVARAIRLVE
jgi:hypothetical protein